MATTRHSILVRIFGTLALTASLATGAQPTVFTVTNTNASGAGSLAGALADMFAACPAGGSRVEFNIPAATDPNCNAGTGICKVQVPENLEVRCSDTVVDGYTQPGASPNSATDMTNNAQLKIELASNTATQAKMVAVYGSSHPFGANAIFNVTLRGLALPQHRIQLQPANSGSVVFNGGGHVVSGNWFGFHADGTIETVTPSHGLAFYGNFMTGVTIGGPNPADRNLITYVLSACCYSQPAGIRTFGTSGTLIEGNYFNVAPDGNEVAGNQMGGAIYFSFDGSQVQNTVIRNNVVRALTAGTPFFLGLGPGITSSRNSITGQPAHLPSWSFTPASQGGANSQVSPVITGVTLYSSEVVVSGTVESAADRTVRLEFFHNSQPYQAGAARTERFAGFLDVNVGPGGSTTFSASLPADTRNIAVSATDLTSGETSLLNQATPPPEVSLARLIVTNAGAVDFLVSGVACPAFPPAACRAYALGTTVILTAQGAGFTGWSGGCTPATSPTCNIVMDGDKTLTANYGTTFAVTPSAGANGSISPPGQQIVVPGGTAVFTVTANAGYIIASVGGTCGGSLNGSVYTTNPVNQACTVEASFTPGALYIVTSTAETGPGTLTAALTHLNANCGGGSKGILFNIPAATDPGCNAGTGVCVVQLEFFNGHNISCNDVLVDGYTQPGASPNTLAGLSNDAQLKIELAGTDPFFIGHDNVTMRGIAFASVSVNVTLRQVFGVGLVSVANPVFSGSSFGWHADGLTPVGGPNGPRIKVNNGQAANVTGARVGGPDPADRNMITYAGFGDGIALDGASGALIEANLFNLDRNGNPVASASTVNAISSNVGGNSANVIRRNVITRTRESGFTCSAGNGTTLTENEIYDINLTAQAHPRGIRMEAGCNHDQAAPVLTNLTLGATVDVQGTLAGAANETFRIEFFHNSTPDTGNLGLGEEVAGHLDLLTNGAGNVTFSTSLPAFVRNVTATATRLSTGDTSTFSAAGTPAAPFKLTVTNGSAVTFEVAGVACPATLPAVCRAYAPGTPVILTAQSAGFTGWSGGCTPPSSPTCSIAMDGDKTLTANYAAIRHTLTVVADGSGYVTSSPAGINCAFDCTEDYDTGTLVTLTPTVISSATFSHWTGGCTGSGTCVVTMNGPKAVTAHFVTNRLTVQVSPGFSGSVHAVAPSLDANCDLYCEYDLALGAQVTLTATPSAGNVFTGWTGACSGTGPCTFAMGQAPGNSLAFVANFAPLPPLTLSVTTSGSGTVTSNPAGISCGATCSKAFAAGTVVTLTPTAISSATFLSWSGACTGSGACVVTMDAAKSVTANFTTNRLTIDVLPQGSGSVRVVATGFDQTCTTHCVYDLAIGAQASITATPTSANTFAGWNSGAQCSFLSTACTLVLSPTLNGHALTANFAPKTAFALNVSTSAGGTVTSNPAGIDCGATCSKDFNTGTVVTLTPTPTAGFAFSGWSGACTGSGACSVTMDAAKHVTATFVTGVRSLSINVFPPGLGSVRAVATGFDQSCSALSCIHSLDVSASVTLTATPTPTGVFTGWGGACSGTAPTCTLSMTSGHAVTANFAQRMVTVTVVKVGDGSGSVTGSQVGIECGTFCQVQVPAASNGFDLVATPQGGALVAWSGCAPGPSSNTCHVEDRLQDRTITVTFGLPVNLHIFLGGGPGVITIPDRGLSCVSTNGSTASCDFAVPRGASVTLSAYPATALSSWSGCTPSGATCTVLMDQGRSVIATFAGTARSVSVTAPHGDGVFTVTNGAGMLLPQPDRGFPYAAYPSDVLTLTATPDPGEVMFGWRVVGPTGASYVPQGCNSPAPCVLDLDHPRVTELVFFPDNVTGPQTRVEARIFRVPARMRIELSSTSSPPDSRTARVGTSFNPAPSVVVLDAEGRRVSGVGVRFTAFTGTGGASCSSCPVVEVVSSANGVASTGVRANGIAGTWRMNATAVFGNAAIDIDMKNTNDPVPVTLPGTGKATIPTGSVGTVLAVVVRSLKTGAPVSGATVKFTAPTSPDTNGNPVASGTLTPSQTLSDARGVARTTLRSNGVAGSFSVTVRVTLPAIPGAGNAAGGFEGDDYVTELTVEADAALADAVVTDPMGDYDQDGIPNAVEDAEGTLPFDKDNDVFADPRLFAMQQYRDFLGREGDAGGVTHWTNQLSSGAQTRAQMAETYFNSAEFQGLAAPVARLYFAYFLRIPDYGGLNFWISQFRGGASLESISNAFAGSPEFAARYGALTNAQFVSLVYQNVLGRAPDGPGLAHWTGQINGGMTRGQMMVAFSESAEYRALITGEVYVTMMYVGMLRREPDAAGFSFWVNYLDAGNSGLALTQGFVDAPEYRSRFLP